MNPNVFDDPRITAVGLLFEVHAGLSARFATQLDEHGLSAVEFEVLTRLTRSPGNQLRMTDLAAQTSLSTSGVTRVVDRMERDGLITRRACPSDRRSSYAVVTPSGLRRLDESLPGHLQLIEDWFTGQLDPAALHALLDGLRQIRDAVHPCATAGSSDTAPEGETVLRTPDSSPC
ncbi:MarR family transcriptional regulator [Verrucosispora sp. SN26_14.1]|uniref:MarR family winged helix-turn-helix transcriptional regulator n=1 Tax=Verrucosispora sp. SN26_14.1 TaxID=2527879 RepID=UPI0010337500|nr:MarR family transcriptional regulator [Verrucosispora sp. SN26_14.1]TBL43295.1 MarR family transcriptional regulator [Verrucosispora sp. SN26_14.1]